jgi:hypothetical protein
MANPHHRHGYHGVVQFINHSPITDREPVMIRALHGLDVARVTGIDGKPCQTANDTALHNPVERQQLSQGGCAELNVPGHGKSVRSIPGSVSNSSIGMPGGRPSASHLARASSATRCQ